MNTIIEYTITLLSDAEPGTGLGGELINQRIPRDPHGKPLIPANHLKGLLREELLNLECFPELKGIAARCLGRPDSRDTPAGTMNEAICRFTNAVLIENESNGSSHSDYITRTAIDPERGNALDGSLRTVERIAAGTKFCGEIILFADSDSREALAIQCGFLSIGAIGGNRNRGAGKVLIEIRNKCDLPGDLFEKLQNAAQYTRIIPDHQVPESGTKLRALRLTFTAKEPVCLPERPIGTGPIESGFTIPSSAVRGWIISRIAAEWGKNFASALYESEKVRTWPLLPCGFEGEKSYPIPVRVSLTHKIAKLITDGMVLSADDAEDKPIHEVNWDHIQSNSPLKAADGVLLVSRDSKEKPAIELWKARSMPKITTAHGVHNDPQTEDGRNLYQMESIVPMVWSGYAVLPECWADIIIQSIEKDPAAAFGRFRSTHGFGSLAIEDCTDADQGLPWSKTGNDNILILQSPILLDEKERSGDKTANRIFEDHIRSEWADLFAKLNNSWNVQAISTNIGIQFGWNRNEEKGTGKGQRQDAALVVLPGSIFEIAPKEKIEGRAKDAKIELSAEERQSLRNAGLAEHIQHGLGAGFRRGFGAVSVHPGIAGKLYSNKSINVPHKKSNKKEMTKKVLDLWQNNKEKQMPSPSQISAVAGIAAKDRNKAAEYLDYQIKRLESIWAAWGAIQKNVKKWLEDKNMSDDVLQFGLKFLADLVKYQKKIKK
ncbi:MAG: hypothetical protein Q4G69_11520 [Planctomycetia bacterium]|nr:hypothetical protein [Planctomycetia bacterium]